jgi:hypothetical protein
LKGVLAVPLLCAVLGNILYHLSQKLTPAQANPFLSLAISFAAASLGCLFLYIATSGRNVVADISVLSWTTIGLGLSVIVIETGFLLAYRAGWRIGLLSLVVTVCQTAILLPIGRALFGDRVGWTTLAGVAVSLAGLGLITWQAAPR